MAEESAAAHAGPVPRLIAWALARKPVRAFLLYSEHRGPMLADSITYRALFSVFAAVLLGFSIAVQWLGGNPDALQALAAAVDRVIPGLVGPGGLIDITSIEALPGQFVAAVIAIVGLVGASIGAIGSLRTAIRAIADKVHDDVFFLWVLLRNLGIAIGFGGALALSAVVTFLGTAGVGILAGWLGLPADAPIATLGAQAVAVIAVFALDAVALAAVFRVLSGLRPSPRALWSGALLGAIGLTVLQQLSGLFVGGATSNPLLATFAALIALLLWFNLSAQVILIASAYIVTGVAEEADRVRERHGAATFAQRRVRRAEESVRIATEELAHARDAEEAERAKA
ncbi:YihY/virulence factor BrkB family protein [Microbacterium sp. CJ88]|uniref:YihY/virulence factor BrkB family protein n=1 Tax=Microbacterium sp. CJ88 TaxID=3445672 RepID=UPI003F65FA38